MDVFFYLGIALVIAALALAAVGLRSKGFPSSKGAFVGVLVAIGALVVVTAVSAVELASEEQEHRNAEIAAEAEEAAPEEVTSVDTTTAEPGDVGAPSVIEVQSPETGALEYDPNTLEASAGSLVIDFTNPSPIPHNIALEDSSGGLLGETETVTGGEIAELTADVTAGDYIYFCTVVGHREAGMEGTLTVN